VALESQMRGDIELWRMAAGLVALRLNPSVRGVGYEYKDRQFDTARTSTSVFQLRSLAGLLTPAWLCYLLASCEYLYI
jgi:hypothetical protein